MKRLAIAAGVVVMGAGGAMAQTCTEGLSEAGGAIQAFETALDLVQTGTGSANCSITNKVPVTGDRFVVYQVKMSGAAYMDDVGATGSFTFANLGGDTETIEYFFNDETEQEIFLRRKYAVGQAPTSFSGDYEVSVDGNGEVAVDQIIVSAATTTLAEQEESLGSFGLQQAGIVTHLDGMTGLLTGATLPLEGRDEFGVIGGYGSYMAGVSGRLNLADGFSVLGGVSAIDFSLPGATANGFAGAATLRYVQPETGAGARMFGEFGAHASALSFGLSREYDDGLNFEDPTASGTGDGWLVGAYLRGGVMLNPIPDHELVLSASLAQNAFTTTNFAEADPDNDPDAFTADLSGTSVGYTTIKAGADWIMPVASDVELAVSLGVGTTRGNAGVSADVFGVSDITGNRVLGAAQSTIFAQYGLRLGWMPTDDTRIEGFVQGTTGTGIGTHAQVGAAYKLQF